MEIERKFLVDELPCLDGVKSSKIKQGYISLSPEVRVRKMDEKYYRTEKGEGMIAREEREWEITKDEGEALFKKIVSNLIEKTRYFIPLNGYIAELDVYEGIFKGLVVCEVEFQTLDEAKSFSPPAWLGEDISEQREYRNKILALKAL